MKKHCRSCGKQTKFKLFSEGLYKYNGEKVYTCRTCGHLRTKTEMRIVEAEMIHKPTQKKYKEMNHQ